MTSSSVLIIGGGAFGTSAAFHLSNRGYSQITVLDRFAAPSKDAAATDLNKTVRHDYPNRIYSELAQEAMMVWKSSDHPLSGLFKQTGWIMAAGQLARNFIDATYRTSGSPDAQYISSKDINTRWPELDGSFSQWTSLWSPEAGWVESSHLEAAEVTVVLTVCHQVPSGEALSRLALAAQTSGVRYIHGPQGHVVKLLFDESGSCIGALSEAGSRHLADIVILAAGARTGELIDVKNEIIAKAMGVATIQLTANEARRYQNIPMFDHFEQGMIFPPNDAGILKLCSCRYITNYCNSPVPGVSVGRSYADWSTDQIPTQIGTELRMFLKDVIPELADRPWAWTRMCWDADSKDSDFRICPHPHHRSLFIASAGSLHGFKFLPTIGKYIADMVEGKLDEKLKFQWRWRYGANPPSSNIERHPYPPRDLGHLDGWKAHDIL